MFLYIKKECYTYGYIFRCFWPDWKLCTYNYLENDLFDIDDLLSSQFIKQKWIDFNLKWIKFWIDQRCNLKLKDSQLNSGKSTILEFFTLQNKNCKIISKKK